MRLSPASELFWYEIYSVAIHPACRLICVYDLARFCFSLAQLIEDFLDEGGGLVEASLTGVCIVLSIQLFFTTRSFLTLRTSQPDWPRLKHHYRIKIAAVVLETAAYAVYMYAVEQEGGGAARMSGFLVCVAMMIVVELYLSYGLYSGYHIGERGTVAVSGAEEAPAPPRKEVIGRPYVPTLKTPRQPVEFEIPIFDYTGWKT